MPKPRTTTPPRPADQIKRDIGRLNAAKGVAMRDMKAIAAATGGAKKARGKAKVPAAPPQGIHMGDG